MRDRVLITLLASLGLLFVMLPAAQADVPLIFSGTTSGDPNGQGDPYLISVNGTNMWLNCDDYNDHVTGGETWQAMVIYGWDTAGLSNTRMSQLNMTTGSPYHNASYNAAIAYDELAWVELNYSSASNPNYSYAIWQIFENIGQATDPVYTAAVAAVSGDSLNGYATYRNRLTIYTPDQTCSTCKQGTGGTWTDGVPQEFTTVPDGGVTLMLLGGALVGLETLRRRFRV